VKVIAPIGNGRVLAYVAARRRQTLSYVRATNVLRVASLAGETRYAGVGDEIRAATRGEGWPLEFDPPPLAGATRATVTENIPDLDDRRAVSDVYARSVLVIAQHQELSGAFIAEGSEDILLAHALDVCGERGASEAFFDWALGNRTVDGLLMWGLEGHMHWSRSAGLRELYEGLRDGPGPELAAEFPSAPRSGPAAILWRAWRHALGGRRAAAISDLEKALARRSSVDLFVTAHGIDLGAHALFLLAVHALRPPVAGSEDFFFEHQAFAQQIRRARALYGGAFHGGMPVPGDPPLLDVELREDLLAARVTVETVAGHRVAMQEVQGRWLTPLPAAHGRDVVRYRVEVRPADENESLIWASDTDPRPGGQVFEYEAAPDPPPDWLHDAIAYQVMVDRFARPGSSLPPPGSPTALYGGTLDGVQEHLDHIAALGCNVLWLSPVHQSPSHHGYDHEDYFKVEPRYGGEAPLKRLIGAAHGRGIRVLLDFVPNHTGRGHHLFRDAIAHGGDKATFYRFWQWPHYYRCFGDVISLPELDTAGTRVQEYLVSAARHWVTEYGADGVRCDHVAGVDPAFWVELRRGLRAVKPDALVLGEATGSFQWLARYAGRLDAIFDFDFAHVVRQALARGRMDPIAFARWMDEHEREFPGLAMATLIDNHDMNRFLWMAGGRVERLKLASTLLMTLPGMPVIYYGTEVGLTQRHDGAAENAEARLPMLWGADQDQDLLAHFRSLGRLRRGSAALRRGTRRTVLADSEVLAYERELDAERVVVALNFSDTEQRREIAGQGMVALEPLGSVVLRTEGSPSPT
jgi:cyclomaltodextrinase / maltogenic alpha-amylase / neopullulanase